MRKQIALMATVAALAISPALAQTTPPNQDMKTTPQAQPMPQGQTTQSPSTTPSASPSTMPSTKAASSDKAMSADKFVNTQASGQWLASDLIGLTVVGSNNESIGSVSDLLVDEDGNILAAVVGVGGFLGIGQKNVAISFDAFDITRDKDGDAQGRLTLTKKELESAPEFKSAEAARSAADRPATPATKPATPATPRN